ncbi:hypothetical protein Chor_017239 [Crotalus horridus]
MTDGRNEDSDEDYGYRGGESGRHPGQSRQRTEAEHNRGYDGDSSSERSSGHYRDDDNDSAHRQPLRSRVRSQERGYRRRSQDKYGLKLGSQIFIKHITETGLAAKDNSLQEGDLILKINGVVSKNMSLEETRQLIEQSEGKLTLLVLRDNSQFLVNIPQVRDSDMESSHLDGNNSILQNDGISGYSPDSKVVRFVKAKSIGLRLAGGNDVGIFVAGVQEGSPAEIQGLREGNQILQVNEKPFHNLTREDAVQYLMELVPGEEVTFHVQNKQDIYKKMVQSNLGDSFYIRTHFDFEKDTPSALSFTRGEVFHVIDTMAEQFASLESVLKATSKTSSVLGARAEFWKLRGVFSHAATFKRPIVILGPIADIAMQKLSTEMPDQFQIAGERAWASGMTRSISYLVDLSFHLDSPVL